MNGEATTKQASWWVLIAVALVLGGLLGYYLGSKRVGSGFISNGAQESTAETSSVVDEIAEGVETPANPFEEGGGYTNPFEGINVNPFAN